MCWGCQGGVTSYITLQCSLTVYYPNYSEVKRNSHLFLENPKWLPNTSHNIYTMMYCNCCYLFLGGGRSARRSAKVELILTTRCQYWEGDLPADLPKLNSSWPLDVSTGGLDLPGDLGVDLPNLTHLSFLLCFTEGLFILHMKDLIRNYNY